MISQLDKQTTEKFGTEIRELGIGISEGLRIATVVMGIGGFGGNRESR